MGQMLICKEASASTVITDLVLAMEAKKAGVEIGVYFTEEAVVALCHGVFDWPRQLCGQQLRLTMADSAAALGLPTMGGKGEARQIDVRGLVDKAVKAGVPVYASELWLKLTGLQARLPAGIKVFDMKMAIASLKQQDQAIAGS